MKIYYNGIRDAGVLYKGWWSKGSYTARSGIDNESITFYADGNRMHLSNSIKSVFAVKNDSDVMTDYFEDDRFVVAKGHSRYVECLEAWAQQEAKRAARIARKR